MRKGFVFLLCLLMVITIVACKNGPEKGGELEPEEGETFYRLTATREAKRFAFCYSGDAGLFINPEAGDELTVIYRTNHAVTHMYLRDAAGELNFANKETIDDYVSDADEDGWITFTFVFPETGPYGEDGSVSGFLFELANYESGSHEDGKGKFAVGDYLDILEIRFNNEWLPIEAAGKDGRSNQGVWNRALDDSNTDHTIPTLEVEKL